VVYETEVKKSYVAGLLKNAVTTLNPMTLQDAVSMIVLAECEVVGLSETWGEI